MSADKVLGEHQKKAIMRKIEKSRRQLARPRSLVDTMVALRFPEPEEPVVEQPQLFDDESDGFLPDERNFRPLAF